MKVTVILFVAIGLCSLSTSVPIVGRGFNATIGMGDEYIPLAYKTAWYETQLDHFNFEVNESFKVRYLYNEDYFQNTPEKPGPIFVYAGNEGPIQDLWSGSGFWTNVMTQKHGALLMFLEHRYFGESLPFGKNSTQPQNIQYLTIEQAMADYGVFLGKFKKEKNLENSPVIIFGGSYGGMLAAWMRMKYPQVIDGALASSAPLLMFQNITSPYSVYEVVSKDFTDAGCGGLFAEGFRELKSLSNRTEYYDVLTKELNLCAPITNSDGILGVYQYVKYAMESMAQYDYPYPTTFNGPEPGSPVTVACERAIQAVGFNAPPKEETFLGSDFAQPAEPNIKLLQGMVDAANIVYNPYGTNKCNSASVISDASGHDGPSDYMACTAAVLPRGTNGVTDFFWDQPWDYEAYAAVCEGKWGVPPRPYWIPEHFGGFNYERDFAMYSNIIFSQGSLDPWHLGGVRKNIPGGKDLVGFVMEGAAHHLDLRYPSLVDPVAVTRGRQTEDFYVTKWVREAIERNLSEPNPNNQ